MGVGADQLVRPTCENFPYSFKAGLRPAHADARQPAVRPVLASLRSGRSSAAAPPRSSRKNRLTARTASETPVSEARDSLRL